VPNINSFPNKPRATTQMKKMLSSYQKRVVPKGLPDVSGWLKKRANFLS